MASITIIPLDVITTHVLRHLPSKSVARFRCVSKGWLSLLTDPRFIQTHQKTLNRNHFIFKSNGGLLYSVPFDNHEPVSTQTKKHDFGYYPIDSIHGSVNGLVLASAYNKLHNEYVIILNPTTNDYVELPPISSQEQYYHMKGFGYDSVSDDYKVVIISYWYSNVHVYSLRTNTWNQLSDSPYDRNNYNLIWGSGVFVNGFLHWIFESDSKWVIVAFSLADEKFSELPPPNFNNVYIEFDRYTELVALGEKLVMVDRQKGHMWLMNEYGVQKSWTKILLHDFCIIPWFFCDNGKVMFLTSNQLWKCDIEEQTLCRSVDISYMKIRDVKGSYAESLISPRFSRSK